MEVITVKKARYYPFEQLFGEDRGTTALLDVQERRSFIKDKSIRLRQTVGGYLPIDGRQVLVVMDIGRIAPMSEEWAFIGRMLRHLLLCVDSLDEQARLALGHLDAIVFTRQDNPTFRSFAEVRRRSFVYDVQELRVSLENPVFVSLAFAASNIMHDANHIRQFETGVPDTGYHGYEAERQCMGLQIDNAAALGLSEPEVEYLRNLVAHPELFEDRIKTHPKGDG